MRISNKKGFTLIEVLVVVSIIGLLASVVLVGLGGFRSRGRDARRVTDLKSLQNGMELYFARNNAYPNALGDLITAGIGITKLPKDPAAGADYFYSFRTADRQSYVLSARLDATAGDTMFSDSNSEVVVGNYTGTVTNCAAPYYCVSF
jgi:prepilin-type N-terminal cleavage/methylation domain-containing protein